MMEEQPADVADSPPAAEDLRADLVETAQHTAEVMSKTAATRESAAANYREMARGGGPDSARYLQHAEQLEDSAARARRFTEQEVEQIGAWQQSDGGQDAAG